MFTQFKHSRSQLLTGGIQWEHSEVFKLMAGETLRGKSCCRGERKPRWSNTTGKKR